MRRALMAVSSVLLALVLFAATPATAQTLTWGHWRIGDALMPDNKTSTLEASLNNLQAQGWTIYLVAPLVRTTNPAPCDLACVRASGQGWAWGDSLAYDIVAYKTTGPAVQQAPTPVIPAPQPTGLPVCTDRTGAPSQGWVKTPAGGWVPPSSALAASGVCQAS